jgi:hypothetical protein
MSDKNEAAHTVLRIELLEIRPLIWRRVRVARSASFKRLHEILQIVLGWQNSHPHEFRAGELVLSMKGIDEFEERAKVQYEDDWNLKDLLDSGVKEFEYAYDFGDGWEHRIVVEPSTRSRVPGPTPLCLAGENACPPEDVGGPHRYGEFLEAIAESEHEEHARFLEWIGGVWDPKGFDLNRVNRELRRPRRGER